MSGSFIAYISKKASSSKKFIYMITQDMESIGITPNEIVLIRYGKKRTVAQCVISNGIRNKGIVHISESVAYQLGIVNDGTKIKISKCTLTISPKIDITFETELNVDAMDDKEIDRIKSLIMERFYHAPFIAGESNTIVYNNKSFTITLKGIDANSYIIMDKNKHIRLIKRNVSESKDVIIAGMSDIIKKIEDLVIKPLSYPSLFYRFNNVIPISHCILLTGPTGVGKTLLMKYIKSRCNVNFVEFNFADIFQKFYGDSEKKIQDLFEEARRNSPSIIFIDEIDTIASRRSYMGGDIERRIAAQLITEMDKIGPSDNIIIIGATNKIDDIDPSFRRAGRFDTEIFINSPNEEERKEIFHAYLDRLPIADDVDFDTLAKITNGYVGADIYGVVRSAIVSSINAVIDETNGNIRDRNEGIDNIKITMKDLEDAIATTPPSVMRDSYFEIPDVSMDHIGGLDDAKRAIEEAVEWRIDPPKELLEIGGKSPSGILLYGPPGVGKSMLGKAVANKKGIRFFLINGPEILSEWLGGSERAIRDVFSRARMSQPCVVFIDEIDAIAPQRGRHSGDSHTIDRLVNQLLVEIDGINSIKNIVVMAATNRPDILDGALLRTGRFDYKVYIPSPDKEARREILRSHIERINKVRTDGSIDYDHIANITEHYSGSDIAAAIRIAITRAVRDKRNYITNDDLIWAIKDKVSPSIDPSSLERYKKFREMSAPNDGIWVDSSSSLYS